MEGKRYHGVDGVVQHDCFAKTVITWLYIYWYIIGWDWLEAMPLIVLKRPLLVW